MLNRDTLKDNNFVEKILIKNIAKKSNESKNNKDELIQISSGTGFAVTDKGHLVTNNHVIDSCLAINLHLLGK